MKTKKLYKIERPIYSFEQLKKDFEEEKVEFNIFDSMKYKARCKKRSIRSIFSIFLPLPFILASFYNFKCLLYDFISGITMTVFHIPQGLAYGLLSGLQPINGLYASLFPPFIYAFFGTSRHLSIGTFSIMALLSSVPVLREIKAENINTFNDTFNNSIDQDRAYELEKLKISISTTLLAGIIQVVLGLFQFGCLISYMSDALIDAFTSAASIHVVMSQISNLLGYSIVAYSGIGELPYKTYMFIINLKETNIATLVVSFICIIILEVFADFINPFVKKKYKFPIPIQFIIVVLGTVISYFSDLNRRYKIKIVGPVPQGFPSVMIPDFTYWNKVFTDAILLALIGFVMNCSLVKVYSLKFSYDVNYNQEVFAYGLSNIMGSFFQCTMSAGALARTSVVVEVGMKSQIASLISCSFMLLIILFIGSLFTTVPKAVLSAIIVVSLSGLLKKITCLPKLWYLSKFDFSVWIVTYISTLFLNVPFGLVFGFMFSLLTIIIRLQNPKSQILGQIPNTDLYVNIKLFKDAKEIKGIKIFRYDSPIYFANAEHFQAKLYKKTGVNPNNIIIIKDKSVTENDLVEEEVVEINASKLRHVNVISKKDSSVEEGLMENHLSEVISPMLRYVIINCSSVNYIDNVGIRILEDIYKSYHKMDISLYLTSLNGTIRDMLERANFAKENRERITFLTVHDAVLATNLYQNVIE